MSLIVCFTWLLLVCHEAEPAVTAFGSLKPSKSTFVRERDNVALKWNYTIDGSIGSAQFLNATDDVSIAAKFGDGDVTVAPKYQERFKADISNTLAQFTILTVQRSDGGRYKFRLTSSKLDTISDEVELKVQFEPSITGDSGNQTEPEGTSITLFCNTSGYPNPNITWTKANGEEVSFESPWVIKNINKTDSGRYRCTAYNGIGSAASRLVYVNVTYPAKIDTSSHKRVHEVAVKQSVTLDCPAEGNPQPTFTWTPCDPQQSVCHERTLVIPKVLKDTNYSCRVENYLGSETANTSLFIASDVINVTMDIVDEECTDGEYNQLWEKLSKTIDVILNGTLGYESVELKDIRCGRIIVDLALKFNSTVRESVVLSILQDADNNGKFGEFNVGAITGTRDIEIKTTVATTPTSSSDSTTWIIVGVVVGVVVLLGVAGGVAWYVYKKRKCKKRDSKVHNNGSQGEAGGNVQGEGHVQVNKGYEERANRRSGGGNTSSAPPVLYDTAQTGNRGAVKEPPLPQYAVVDKSKKKPKKPKPGELQYAELAEFSTGQGGQRSSLSPTNRLTETQYADVNAM